MENFNYRKYVVKVTMWELIDNDLEGVLDLLSELATGSPLMMDVQFRPIEVDVDGGIFVEVLGDMTMVWEAAETDDNVREGAE